MVYNIVVAAGRYAYNQSSQGQTSDNTRKYDNTVYLQFLLTVLTTIGTSNNGSSSPSDILSYVIPGYDDDFGKDALKFDLIL